MTFDTALWRGFDRSFVEAITGILSTPMNAELATVTIASSTERPVLAFSIHDGTAEHVILATAALVNVHRRIDGQPVGRDVTLTDDGAGRVRAACDALLERIKTRGGFQESQEPIH